MCILFARSDAGIAIGGMLLLGILFAALVLVLWLLPVLIAQRRHHPQTASIAVITVLLGWSLIGWTIAMCWAVSSFEQPLKRKKKRYRREGDYDIKR